MRMIEQYCLYLLVMISGLSCAVFFLQRRASFIARLPTIHAQAFGSSIKPQLVRRGTCGISFAAIF